MDHWNILERSILMTTCHVSAIEKTVQKTHEWLREIVNDTDLRDQSQAWSVLRVVLLTLRDRLTEDEAVQLGAQLPTLIRGMYYEGWKPAMEPTRLHTRDEFLAVVHEGIRTIEPIDAAHAVKAVFKLLGQRISWGEVEDVAHLLPPEIRNLWPPI
jgi:uncharacterized protein (DUF2267 family)